MMTTVTQQATTSTTRTASTTFSAPERAALHEGDIELKATQSKADEERTCLATIAQRQGAARTMAERIDGTTR